MAATKRKKEEGSPETQKQSRISKATAKDITKLLESLNSKLDGRSVAKSVGDSLLSEVKQWIPTGIPPIDLLLGGGLPVGKVVEFHGKEKCGKSTIALQACVSARKLGGWVFYIDTEHTLEKDRIQHIGVDLDDPMFTVLEPTNFEEGFRAVHNLIKASKEIESLKDVPFFLVVWDTLAFTASESEFDEKGEFKHDMGKRAGRLRQYMRRLIEECASSNICFMSLNHETENLSNTNSKMKSFSTPGGTAFKFASSLTVRMIPVNGTAEKIMVGNDQVGLPVRFKLIHTRLSPAKREVEGVLNFYSGFDPALSAIRYIKDPETKMVEKKGNNYVFKVPGREDVMISTGAAGEAKFAKLWTEDEEFKLAVIDQMKTHYERIVPWKNPNFGAGVPVEVFDEEFEPPQFHKATEEEGAEA